MKYTSFLLLFAVTCSSMAQSFIKTNIRISGKPNVLNELVGTVDIKSGDSIYHETLTRESIKAGTLSVPVSEYMSIQAYDAFPGYKVVGVPTLDAKGLNISFVATKAVYLFSSYKSPRPYRIPAIAHAKNGNLVAVSDYRPCGGDIGQGHVNIVAKISKDNGCTWSEEFPVATGNGINESNTCGYGDAAIVADRESNKVFLMSCSAPNPGLCWSKQQRGVMTISEDGGATWPTPVDIKDKIMAVLPADRINYFVGSGKLCQSRYIKVGKYYCIYAALWTTSGRDIMNYVVYTDDMGESWHLLGSKNVCPGPDGNEPKCEELPNGDVILSSRQPWHRLINIFHYTDRNAGVGEWDTPVAGINNGDAPGTDGEIMILKTIRKSDKKTEYIALQSAPNGGRRSKVTIWYKLLGDGTSSKGIWDTSENLASGWTVAKQMTNYNSAYSTMCLQNDNRIAFYYENHQSGYDSDMVYEPLTLEDLGLGEYEIE